MRAPVHCVLFLAPGYGRLQPRSFFSNVLTATNHTGGRSHATHARSHPNTLARRHILAAKQWAAAKPPALRNSPTPLELHRQELAPRRLAVAYKPGLHR
jgi:hypothetical protein